ncbi:hypothetical protein JTB14_032863 [Gonioctena quinquepunctata]|nr:hypothetical protein JTB14_032863 [Gonioctena quinquepunctata]
MRSVQDLTTAELIQLIKTTVQEANTLQTDEIKKKLSTSIQCVSNSVAECNIKIVKLETKVQHLERKARKNNIVIFGISINNKSNLLEDTTLTLLSLTLSARISITYTPLERKIAKSQKLSAKIKGFALEIDSKLYTVEKLENLEKEEDSDSEEIIEEQEIPGKPAPQSTTNDGSAIPGRKFAVEKNKRKRSKVAIIC